MTVTASPTRIHRGADGLVVECTSCGVALTQRPAFDPDVALGTFLQFHPPSPLAVHRPDLPAGWSPTPVTAA